jgi:hypothetical protein
MKRKYLSPEEKERRKNKTKGFTPSPKTSNKYSSRIYKMSLSKRGMIPQYVPANTITKEVEVDGEKEIQTIEHKAKFIFHDPKAVKYSKFINDLRVLNTPEEVITKLVSRFYL